MSKELSQQDKQVEPVSRRTVVYIDGYNLYYGRLRGTSYKWLDVVALFEHILKVQDPDGTLDAVRFFTAPALARFASHGQASMVAQQSYHRALEARHPARFSITLGIHSYDNSGTKLPTFVPGQPFDKTVRSHVWKLEEKKTDVNLAMAMYRDAAKGRVDQVVLCSNDSDAEPVLEALREDFPALIVGVVTPAHPPPEVGGRTHRRVSVSLATHAHWTRKYIVDDELAKAQMPPRVPTRKKPVDKPAHW
jgi:hypothetical protein